MVMANHGEHGDRIEDVPKEDLVHITPKRHHANKKKMCKFFAYMLYFVNGVTIVD